MSKAEKKKLTAEEEAEKAREEVTLPRSFSYPHYAPPISLT